jgi:methylmalonyl-CoA epimerase
MGASKATQELTLNHIGIAVDALPAMRKLFSVLGLSISGTERVQEQGVKVHFIKLPLEPVQIELLEVEDPEGTVAKFIAKRGPGIHHLSFSLPKGGLQGISDRLRQEGFKLIYDEPKLGAHGMRINFIHPASAGGVLLELMEPSL